MRFLAPCAALLLGGTALARENWDGPRIDIEYRITLSTGMEQALVRYDPAFRIWEAADYSSDLLRLYNFSAHEPWRKFLAYQTPAVVVGDFNGDGKADAALMGRNETSAKVLAVLSDGAGYDVVEISSGPLVWASSGKEQRLGRGNLTEVLTLVEPGRIRPFEKPLFELKTDAFQLGGENGSELFVWRKSKFVRYSMGD